MDDLLVFSRMERSTMNFRRIDRPEQREETKESLQGAPRWGNIHWNKGLLSTGSLRDVQITMTSGLREWRRTDSNSALKLVPGVALTYAGTEPDLTASHATGAEARAATSEKDHAFMGVLNQSALCPAYLNGRQPRPIFSSGQ